ncbi:flagellar protein FlaG [Kurthia zopfii]|uniref:flagellar protein FlaG n=1 Tax=Kurthia zopfii TaxID=1650 RepID=UPI000F718D27|nr:flagellar protein FlaG [Kurthia zopfii]VEI04980.1 flagellar protein FlaG [Kurthia zopfii]
MKISSDTTLEHTRNISVQKNTTSINHQAAAAEMNISEMTDAQGKPTKQAYQTAVNKMNEFMEHTNKNSKFIFHEGLGKYYVEVVDSKTDEVVKEIPPKQLLDAYYEMQKMIGNIVDYTI